MHAPVLVPLSSNGQRVDEIFPGFRIYVDNAVPFKEMPFGASGQGIVPDYLIDEIFLAQNPVQQQLKICAFLCGCY